jgi:hypothetical protein
MGLTPLNFDYSKTQLNASISLIQGYQVKSFITDCVLQQGGKVGVHFIAYAG